MVWPWFLSGRPPHGLAMVFVRKAACSGHGFCLEGSMVWPWFLSGKPHGLAMVFVRKAAWSGHGFCPKGRMGIVAGLWPVFNVVFRSLGGSRPPDPPASEHQYRFLFVAKSMARHPVGIL